MLSYYATHFSTVEINHTFRGLPSGHVLDAWLNSVPGSFRFALKAPALITHRKRLRGVEEAVKHFIVTASVLKERRGPLLFQLPPNLKKDLPRLKDFLSLLGKRDRAALEFRHESWHDEEVFECLRKHSCALCVADIDETSTPRTISTADWGYLRLRKKRYTNRALGRWLDRVNEQTWREAYIFFKHEDSASGPTYVTRLLGLVDIVRS